MNRKRQSRNSSNVFKAQTNAAYTRLAWTNNQFKLSTVGFAERSFFKQTLGPSGFSKEYGKARPLSIKKTKGLAQSQGRDMTSSVPIKVSVMSVKKSTGGRNRGEKFEERVSSLCEIYNLIDFKKIILNTKDNHYTTKSKFMQRTSNRPDKITLTNSKEGETNVSLIQDISRVRNNKSSTIHKNRNKVTQSKLHIIERSEDDTQLTFRSNNKSCDEASKRSKIKVLNQMKAPFFFNLKYRGMEDEQCSTPVFQE